MCISEKIYFLSFTRSQTISKCLKQDFFLTLLMMLFMLFKDGKHWLLMNGWMHACFDRFMVSYIVALSHIYHVYIYVCICNMCILDLTFVCVLYIRCICMYVWISYIGCMYVDTYITVITMFFKECAYFRLMSRRTVFL